MNNKPPVIKLTPVKSSQIQQIGFDPETKTLAIRFNHGKGEYRYAGVSPEIYGNMTKAESIGKFFSANIKNKFKHVLIQPEQKS